MWLYVLCEHLIMAGCYLSIIEYVELKLWREKGRNEQIYSEIIAIITRYGERLGWNA